MPQAFLAWGTSHVFSVGPCCDDHCQPQGVASPARRDAPRRSSGIPCVRTAPPGSVAGAPCRPSATPCAHSGEPGLVENAPQPASTAPAGADRAPQGASSSAWAPSSNRPSPTTGTFHAAGCVSPRAGAFDAVGDSNPVPVRVTCPRPHRNVPARAGCPQPRHLSVGPPWHPEPLVRQLHQRRRPTTTSGPHTGTRSGQTGQDAASSSGGEAPSRGVRVPDPHRSGWLTPIPAAQRVRRGPPGAPGYGHRPAPAHCAGGP